MINLWKKFTPAKKNLHGHRPWRPRQISGMLDTLGPLCLWQCLELVGSILVPFDSLFFFVVLFVAYWYFLVVFCNFWFFWVLCGTFWKLLVVFWYFLVLCVSLWYFLVLIGAFWYFLVLLCSKS